VQRPGSVPAAKIPVTSGGARCSGGAPRHIEEFAKLRKASCHHRIPGLATSLLISSPPKSITLRFSRVDAKRPRRLQAIVRRSALQVPFRVGAAGRNIPPGHADFFENTRAASRGTSIGTKKCSGYR
jgi:hypothetical protein